MTEPVCVRELLAKARSYFDSIADDIEERDAWEMALNAYFRGNPLSRLIFAWRLVAAGRLGRASSDQLVIDFGCGPGIFSAWLAARTSKVVAVDIKPALARGFLSHLSVDNVDVCDPDSLTEGGADTVYALDVLEHIQELEPVVRRLRDSLKPGGALVLSGPTENFIYRLGRKLVRFPGDYHHWSVKEIEGLLSRTGWRELDKVVLPAPGPWALFHVARFEKRAP